MSEPITEATRNLIAAIAEATLEERVAAEAPLRELWERAGERERWIVSAVVAALDVPPKEAP